MQTILTQNVRPHSVTRPAVKPKANTNGKVKTRKRRRSDDSVTMQITTTRIIQRALDRIVLTGLYGNSRAAAAERLLSEGIRQLLKEGTILRVSKIFLDKSK